MSRRTAVKPNHRFVLYIPSALRKEIEDWVNKMGITFAEFGREAFELYLHKKRKEEKNAQLAETCRMFESKNKSILDKWAGIEAENWPA
ncbi:hypothetical protein IID10_02335 [candidate division KSB1 bacterium]|nr:hypothetical protein [candidate division KSB1 bacterium]